MTFNDFISKYDFPGSIVLMEGKSDVKDDDKPLLTSLGHKLASSTKHMIFRSGDATGSDQFFSQGIVRDTVKAIRNTDIPHATFGIFYDDLTIPMQGGTGHNMDVCQKNGIPFINQ